MRLILDEDKKRLEEALSLVARLADGRWINGNIPDAHAATILIARVLGNIRQIERAASTMEPLPARNPQLALDRASQ